MTEWQKQAAPLLSILYSDALVVVTAAANNKLNGQIALAAIPASIIVEKPRVLLEIWQNNLTHDLIKQSAAFGVHLLKPAQFEPVRRFGFSSGRDHAKFDDTIKYQIGQTNSPLLEDCYGWLECRLQQQLDCGDMTVFVGEVVNAHKSGEGEVLTWRTARKTLPQDWLDEYDRYRRSNENWARTRLGLPTLDRELC